MSRVAPACVAFSRGVTGILRELTRGKRPNEKGQKFVLKKKGGEKGASAAQRSPHNKKTKKRTRQLDGGQRRVGLSGFENGESNGQAREEDTCVPSAPGVGKDLLPLQRNESGSRRGANEKRPSVEEGVPDGKKTSVKEGVNRLHDKNR